MIEVNKIYNQDCQIGIKQIDDNSIDLIITDPPYLIDYQSAMRSEKFNKIEGDKGIESDYVLITNSLNELNRVLKEGSHIYMFCSWHNVDFFKQEFQKHFELKNILVWKKKGGFIGDLETQYGVDYEFILYGYKKWDYFGAELKEESFSDLKKYSKMIQDFLGLTLKQINRELGHRRAEHFFYHSSTQYGLCTEKTYNELIDKFKINSLEGFRTYIDLKTEYEELNQYYLKLNSEYDKRKSLNGKRISGIIETSKVNSSKYIHPTQKPNEIIEILINKSSQEGDIILDCFMGSGTTAIGCLNTNRQYIGFELDKNYYDIANKRIEDYLKDLNNVL